jgi:hypothetical protein
MRIDDTTAGTDRLGGWLRGQAPWRDTTATFTLLLLVGQQHYSPEVTRSAT